MIKHTKIVYADGTYPYRNMAVEEYLTDNVPDETCILFLWQNAKTVVIGQNQNAWQECKTQALKEDGGHLARRLSGGGAVFHDDGNLNFTFILPRADFDIARQSDVILRAVRSFGISAVRSGRNDILAEGQKFSGNAFLKRNRTAYHHGTILIDVDMQNMSHYLNVAAAKLESNGVKSVKSRVCNLHDLSADITVESMSAALISALAQEYGANPEPIAITSLDSAAIDTLTAKFASTSWQFGKKLNFNCEFTRKFAWGMVNLRFFVERGVISHAEVFSDAMDNDLISALAPKLSGVAFGVDSIQQALAEFAENQEIIDIISMVNI